MTKPYTIRKQTSDHSNEFVDFAKLDRKDRRIGACITQMEVDFVVAEDQTRGGWCIDPGHYFAMICQATRNTVDYGASQPWRYFKTAEERDAARAKYLADRLT